ncbi:MAG: DUF2059 domain-containing protein [Opitutaceae bacterium]|nr:DUF2059 domain-containing protein [Opitutaceae bacterium]
MKYLALLLALACTTAFAAKEPAKKPVAAPPPVGPASNASIQEYLTLVDVRADWAKLLAQYEQDVLVAERRILADLADIGEPLNARHKAALANFKTKGGAFLRKELDYAKLEPQAVEFYRGVYTQDEMNNLLAFLKSPLGKKWLEQERGIAKKADAAIFDPLKQRFGLYLVALVTDLRNACDFVHPDQRQ